VTRFQNEDFDRELGQVTRNLGIKYSRTTAIVALSMFLGLNNRTSIAQFGTDCVACHG